MTIFKKRILIDLDGVLNEYGKEKFDENYIPEIKEGAKEFLEELSKKYELYVFTTRSMLLTSKWLIKNDLDIYFKDITIIQKFPHICILMTGRFVLTEISIKP